MLDLHNARSLERSEAQSSMMSIKIDKKSFGSRILDDVAKFCSKLSTTLAVWMLNLHHARSLELPEAQSSMTSIKNVRADTATRDEGLGFKDGQIGHRG